MVRHLLRQGPVVRSLLRTGLSKPGHGEVHTPGPVLHDRVAPRSPELVRDYVRLCGGDASWYRRTVPAHLFSQWGFPILTRAMEDLPYDMRRGLNAGCRIEQHEVLPQGEDLLLAACLEEVDDDGRRALIRTRLVTGTPSTPNALTCWMNILVPLPRKEGEKRSKKKSSDKPTVATEALELSRKRVSPQHARRFAALTGDINPIHWFPPAARMAGFRNTILHGFATLGLAAEALNRTRFSGDPSRLESLEVRFTAPVVLPTTVGVYVHDDADSRAITVGRAPGAPAYLTGTYTGTTP